MHRFTPSLRFASDLTVSDYAQHLMGFESDADLACPLYLDSQVDRCQALYLGGWEQQAAGHSKQAFRAFHELLIVSRQRGHQGWTNAAASAIEALMAAANDQTATTSPERSPQPLVDVARSRSTALCHEAAVLYDYAHFAEAQTAYQQALQVASQEQHHFNISQCLNGLGLLALAADNPNRAITLLRTATQVLTEIDALPQAAIAFHNLAIAHYQAQRYDEARTYFQEAMSLSDSGNAAADNTLAAALTLDYLGRTYAHHQENWLALGSFEAALDVLHELPVSDEVWAQAADVMVQMAAVCQATGHVDVAIACLVDALEIYQILADTHSLVRTLQQLTALHGQLGRSAIARFYQAQIATVFSPDDL